MIDQQASKFDPLALPFVTLDSASTRDVDDAFWVAPRAAGGFRLAVGIADPTKLVPIGSPDDQNARLLGATVYARDHAVRKMLPGIVSENKASLLPGTVRKAFLFNFEIDSAGTVETMSLSRGVIKVAKRLAYEEVPSIIQGNDHPLASMLQLAATLANLLLAVRRSRGAMALYDLSRLVYMTEEGRLLQLTRREEMVGHLIVQETMILTNTHLARYMVDHEIPALYRNHQARQAAPEGADLAATIQTWLSSPELDFDRAKSTFHALIGKASYGASARGHYGVAEPCYTHGTSPLRRYPDLVNLRQVRAHLKGLPFPYEHAALEEMGVALTQLMEDRKEERSEGFKEVVKRKAQGAMDAGDLSQLADHEISQAIKLAGSAPLPPILTAELVRRLKTGIATNRITDRLLMSVEAEHLTEDLRNGLVGWLAASPPRAMQLLNQGLQTGGFPAATRQPRRRTAISRQPLLFVLVMAAPHRPLPRARASATQSKRPMLPQSPIFSVSDPLNAQRPALTHHRAMHARHKAQRSRTRRARCWSYASNRAGSLLCSA